MPDELCLNLDMMDEKHTEFLELLAKIQKAPKEQFLPLFEELIQHTKEHFEFEEKMMDEHGFYDKAEHLSEHKNLLGEMQYFFEKAKKSTMFGKSYINDYAYEKFKRHVINIDSQLASFLKTKVETT